MKPKDFLAEPPIRPVAKCKLGAVLLKIIMKSTRFNSCLLIACALAAQEFSGDLVDAVWPFDDLPALKQ